MDLLQQSAKAWKEIMEYRYLFTYGYKRQLYPISLTFSLKDYPHLAGFQYMKDISLPNYASSKIADRILEGRILFETVQKAAQYDKMIKPRLEALIHLKASSQGEWKCDFLCCSIFAKGERGYETNQRLRKLMKKERIHIPSNTTDVLLDRLAAQ